MYRKISVLVAMAIFLVASGAATNGAFTSTSNNGLQVTLTDPGSQEVLNDKDSPGMINYKITNTGGSALNVTSAVQVDDGTDKVTLNTIASGSNPYVLDPGHYLEISLDLSTQSSVSYTEWDGNGGEVTSGTGSYSVISPKTTVSATEGETVLTNLNMDNEWLLSGRAVEWNDDGTPNSDAFEGHEVYPGGETWQSGTSVSSTVIGHTINHGFLVNADIQADYYYDDATVRYVYGKYTFRKNVSGTTEVVDDGAWQIKQNDCSNGGSVDVCDAEGFQFPNKNGGTADNATSADTHTFAHEYVVKDSFYETGDYSVSLRLVEVMSVFDFDTDNDGNMSDDTGAWTNWNETEVNADGGDFNFSDPSHEASGTFKFNTVSEVTYPFEVVQAAEPPGALTALQNWFSGVVGGIIDAIESIFADNTTAVPDPVTPPTPSN